MARAVLEHPLFSHFSENWFDEMRAQWRRSYEKKPPPHPGCPFAAPIRPYYLVRLFTGLRTAEIDGLQWRYVDFDRQQILIAKTLVDGHVKDTKTTDSYRTVDMSHRQVTLRVWYPLLRVLGLKKRRPYQTRHTAATLWLAAMARLLRHYWTMLSKAPERRFHMSRGSGLRTGPKRHTSKTPLVIIFSKSDNLKCLANLTFDQVDTTITI